MTLKCLPVATIGQRHTWAMPAAAVIADTVKSCMIADIGVQYELYNAAQCTDLQCQAAGCQPSWHPVGLTRCIRTAHNSLCTSWHPSQTATPGSSTCKPLRKLLQGPHQQPGCVLVTTQQQQLCTRSRRQVSWSLPSQFAPVCLRHKPPISTAKGAFMLWLA